MYVRRATLGTSTRTNTLGSQTQRSIQTIIFTVSHRVPLILDLIPQTIDIKDSGSGLQISTRKSKASPYAIGSGKSTSTIRNRSGGRRTLGVAGKYAKRGYRPDLRTVSDTLRVVFVFLSPSLFVGLVSRFLGPCLASSALSLEPAGTRLRDGMKVGRGHVCNINPSPS